MVKVLETRDLWNFLALKNGPPNPSRWLDVILVKKKISFSHLVDCAVPAGR